MDIATGVRVCLLFQMPFLFFTEPVSIEVRGERM